MGEDGGQWDGECGRNGGRRAGGQRDEEEVCGNAIRIEKETRVSVIGIRYGNGGWKGSGKRDKEGLGRECLEEDLTTLGRGGDVDGPSVEIDGYLDILRSE